MKMSNSSIKKKIYIHIGIGKTGTSAFQEMMFQNKDKLISQGIMYPGIGLYGAAHHNLSCLLQSSDLPIERITSSLLEIKKMFLTSECNKLVLSSEHFIYTKPEIIKLYKKYFEGFDVKIIIYIRKQEALIESAFLEWVKNGWDYCCDIDNYFEQMKCGFDFSLLIDPWENIFGEDRLIVKLYDKRLIKDICISMFGIIGVEGKNITLSGSDVNSSLLPGFFPIAHEVNRLTLDDKHRQCIFDELVQLSSKYRNCLKESMVSNELSEKIVKYYFENNKSLSNKFLSKEEKMYFLS